MKSFAIVAACGLLATGCQGELAPAPESNSMDSMESSATVEVTPASFNVEGAPTVTFDVPDMMCQYSCVDAVKKSLKSQPGVKEVKVDFATRQATVVVDQATFNGEAAVASLVDYQFTNSKLKKAK
jgi:copper chaperone CopZ